MLLFQTASNFTACFYRIVFDINRFIRKPHLLRILAR